MELAHLIIRVDGQGVEKAAKDLDGVRVSSSRLEAQEERRANKARDDANKAAKAAEVWKKKYTDAADAQFSYDSKIAASAAKRANALERSWQLQSAIEAKRIAAAERDAAREAAIEAKRVAVAQEAERKIQEARQKTIDKARDDANKAAKAAEVWKKKYTDAADAQFSHDSKIAASAAKRTNALERSWQLQSAIEAKRIAAAERDAAREAAIEAKRVAVAQEAGRKIQEARQKTIDKARLENRFSGSGGGWGGGGSGGGTINGVPVGSFGGGGGSASTSAGISSLVSRASMVVGGALTLNEMARTIMEMEVMEQRLVTVTGSVLNAKIAFAQLQVLDRQLPHDITELTQAFSNLVHFGLTPSEEALRSYSAISSASSQDIERVVVAVQRAVEGEYRNLKVFGIGAENMGDKVKLSFNGMTTVVDNNKRAIEDWFIKLGQMPSFADASVNKMNTMTGAVSNLTSAWQGLMKEAGSSGVSKLGSWSSQAGTFLLDSASRSISLVRMKVQSDMQLDALSYEIDEAIEKYGRGSQRHQDAIKKRQAVIDTSHFGITRDVWFDNNPAESRPLGANRQGTDQEIRLAKQASDWAVKIENYYGKMKAVLEANEDELAKEKRNLEEANLRIAAAEEDKRRMDEIESFRLGMMDEEANILAAYRKRDESIKNFIELSGDERNELQRLSWEQTERELIQVASGRKDALKKVYDDEVRESDRLYKIEKINYEQHLVNMAKAEGKYRKGVSGIFLDNNQRFTPLIGPSEIRTSEGASDLRKQYVGGRASIEQEYKDKSARLWADPEVDEKFEIQAAMDEEERNRIISFEEGNLSIKLSARQAEHEQELRMMRDLHDAGEISTETYHDRMREEARRYQADMAKIGESGNRLVLVQNLQMQAQVLGMAGNIAGQLDQLAQENSDAAKATFLAVKAISIAQALVNTHLGATQALALGPYGIPMSTVILSMGYASAAIMAATSVQEYSGKFADGGFLGGNQTTGDRVLFHGNAGEAVLNGTQQRNFMALANGQGGAGGVTIVINNLAPGIEVVQGQTTQGPDGKMVEMIVRQIKTEMVNDADKGGPHSRMLMARTNLVRTGRSA